MKITRRSKGVKYAMDERDLIADILAEEREREQ